MLNKKQTAKLRSLIEDYAEAKFEEAHAGAQSPADADYIRMSVRASKDALSLYILDLENAK